MKQIEKISKALGDSYRLKIMEMVSQNQKCSMPCCEVLENFDLAQSTMSHHIKQLVDSELLIAEKEGRNLKLNINKDVCNAYSDYIKQLTE